MEKLLLLTTYTLIIASLIWGRFRFFKISSTKTKSLALIYDSLVSVQILATYYGFLTDNFSFETSKFYVASTAYLVCMSYFWYLISSVKRLDFAFSSSIDELLTDGPYKFARHPFYLCYILIWLTSTLLFNSLVLWITLFALVLFYIFAAKSEENAISKSRYSQKYQNYSKNVGMFLPRMKKWTNLFSKH